MKDVRPMATDLNPIRLIGGGSSDMVMM